MLHSTWCACCHFSSTTREAFLRNASEPTSRRSVSSAIPQTAAAAAAVAAARRNDGHLGAALVRAPRHAGIIKDLELRSQDARVPAQGETHRERGGGSSCSVSTPSRVWIRIRLHPGRPASSVVKLAPGPQPPYLSKYCKSQERTGATMAMKGQRRSSTQHTASGQWPAKLDNICRHRTALDSNNIAPTLTHQQLLDKQPKLAGEANAVPLSNRHQVQQQPVHLNSVAKHPHRSSASGFRF